MTHHPHRDTGFAMEAAGLRWPLARVFHVASVSTIHSGENTASETNLCLVWTREGFPVDGHPLENHSTVDTADLSFIALAGPVVLLSPLPGDSRD